jgi:hypothetical protein
MAIEKQLVGRIIHKHDIEENWNKATGFIPKQGEIIVYDIDDNYNYERFKIGDGNTTVINLPFQKTNINDLKAISYDIAQTLTDEQKEQARINIGAASIEDNTPDWNKMTNKPTELVGGDTLTWDGNTEGLLLVFDGTFKVSDAVPTFDDFANGCTVIWNGVPTECSADSIVEIVPGVLVVNGVFCVAENGVGVAIPGGQGMSFPETGTYFNYKPEISAAVTGITIPNYTGFATEKLKDSIIPDTVSRVGHTHSFNDLEDKPFYEETTTVQSDTLTWDGNTEGLLAVDTGMGVVFYRVSDATISIDDFANGASYTVSNGTSGSTTYEEMLQYGVFENIILVANCGAFVEVDNCKFEQMNLTFPKAGFYIMAAGNDYLTSLTIPGYTGFVTTETVVKTLDSKFLPEDIARVSDVDTKLAALVNSAPEKLNTLDELAAALGDDENFANTVTTELGKKINSSDLASWAKSSTKPTYTASEVGADAAGTASGLVEEHNIAEDAHEDIRTNLASKMDKTNPTGTGSFSLNRKTNSTIGDYSFAVGYNTIASNNGSYAEGAGTTASGVTSHAEGYMTTASGDCSHAEGYSTTASGDYSHVEGWSTRASGEISHAEGVSTTAYGNYSHTEGNNTVAKSRSQHVQGELNILDTENLTERGTYAHIVGNG